MNKEEIIKRAKKAAAITERNQKDPRYTRTLGFLVAKGLLHTNQKIARLPNVRLTIEDAIWAGKNVEPRILEVLPAAVIRMGAHFNYDPEKHLELKDAIERLKDGRDGMFLEMPLEKVKQWLNFPLKDRRVKKLNEKKITKTFRLNPQTVAKINALKRSTRKSEATIIEELIEGI